MPSYPRSRTVVRQHIDQMTKTRNFKARNERIETVVLVKSHTERKVSVERKSKWTVFERRLLPFQPRVLSWAKSTIVLFYFKSADTD